MIRKLKMGMVGGGRDAFIGGVHRMAARLDGEIELVAGAFSSDPEKAKRSGEDLSLESERVYRDYQTMVETEARLPVGKRIDFVSIVTPNHLHFPVAKLFLEAGFNVVCDKPMTFDLGRPHTYGTLFGLLASTGMRISEALSLRFQNASVPASVETRVEASAPEWSYRDE
jgi:predicted dehydrogenase